MPYQPNPDSKRTLRRKRRAKDNGSNDWEKPSRRQKRSTNRLMSRLKAHKPDDGRKPGAQNCW